MGGGDAIGPLLHFIAARPIHVTHRDDLETERPIFRRIQDGSHPATGSDYADAEGVVGAQTLVEARAVIPLAMMKLRRFGVKAWAPLQFIPDDLSSEHKTCLDLTQAEGL